MRAEIEVVSVCAPSDCCRCTSSLPSSCNGFATTAVVPPRQERGEEGGLKATTQTDTCNSCVVPGCPIINHNNLGRDSWKCRRVSWTIISSQHAPQTSVYLHGLTPSPSHFLFPRPQESQLLFKLVCLFGAQFPGTTAVVIPPTALDPHAGTMVVAVNRR